MLYGGYEYKYEVDVAFKTFVAEAECENEWSSEEIAGERFDSASNRFEAKLVDTTLFDHKKVDGGYEVTATYNFEATATAINDDKADDEIVGMFDDSEIPNDVEMTISYNGWRCGEAWAV